MTPAERQVLIDQVLIDKAMAIVGPTADRGLVEQDVWLTRVYMGRRRMLESGFYGEVTKKHKKAAKRVADSLKQLQDALGSPDLARHYEYYDGSWLEVRQAAGRGDCEDGARSRADKRYRPADLLDENLTRWRQCYEDAANKPLRDRRYNAVDWATYEAARGAAILLRQHNLPLKLGRAGQFVRLTGLLCGREGTDFRTICGKVRDEIRRRERG
jgi:hypothetical protein